MLNLAFVRELVADCYASGGRPSVDPVVFFKLQLVMFFEGLRSERQLLDVAADRLSLRWYLGYDLDEPLPDHSSLTRIRDRYGLDTFRRFFDEIVVQCQRAGLIWEREFYIDATKVQANASIDSLMPRFAVEAHLADRFPSVTPSPDTAEAAPACLPIVISATRAADLDQTNVQRHDWFSRIGRPNRTIVRGSYHRRSDYEASRTDPDAALMARNGGGLAIGYQNHAVVDGGKARVIVGLLVTPGDVMENQPALDLLWRARFRWQLHPRQITGDTTYATVENIAAIEAQDIRAYVPLPSLDHRNDRYGKGLFRYDADHDCYVCPQGAGLPFRADKPADGVRLYRAAAATCDACAVKAACTHSRHGRQISRSVDEAEVNRVRGYADSEPYRKALRKRQVWVEPLFAEAKQWHGLERFRLRGLPKVNGDALLTAAGGRTSNAC